MKSFAALYAALDASTSTLAKVDAMRRYFLAAAPEDAAWATYFLSGGKPRQIVPTRLLKETARAAAGLPEWLFDESHATVGDLAETIAHVLPPGAGGDDTGLDAWLRERLLPLRGADPAQQAACLTRWWDGLDWQGRFVLNKLITGSLRVGVSRLLVLRALAEAHGLDAKVVAQRIVGYTGTRELPDAQRFLALVQPPAQGDLLVDASSGQPYPFFLAQSLQVDPAERLGTDAARWQVEWKWDGIRAQLVRRAGESWVWSRGEDLVTERFPEIVAAARTLPDGCVLDGEVLAWDVALDRPLPFSAMQTRIGRKVLSKKALQDAPVVLLAYDLLEEEGVDLRALPQHARRARLEALMARCGDAAPLGSPGERGALRLSPLVSTDGGWPALARLREESRARGVEGFMLKRLDAAYGSGRTKGTSEGEWWKWKIDPYTVDAVLLYAQPGSGRRANLYTDYTFAVWSGPPHDASRALVTFAKAYSGLTDEEIRQVDALVRRTTVEKFGPVRSVKPTQVFELGFEGIQRSPRHKSGIAVRFPRMLRWRQDKPVEEADTLDALRAMLGEGG